MIQYIIAGAIGYVVAKLFEEDEAPKYADGGKIDEVEGKYSSLNEFIQFNPIFSKILADLYNIDENEVEDNLYGELGYDEEVLEKIIGKDYRVFYNENNDVFEITKKKKKLKLNYSIQIASENEFDLFKKVIEETGIYSEYKPRFTVKVNNDIIGGSTYFIDSDNFYNFDLAIIEDYQGYGISNKLIDEIIKDAINLNTDGIKVYVVNDALFYNLEKLGFETYISNEEKYAYKKLADGGSVLLAPNGNPSNLTPEQYDLVRTPAFKKWFGDWENDPENASKVVDENGEPLVVYHFSNKDFNTFSIKGNSEGFFFTENRYDDEFSAEGVLKALESGEKLEWVEDLMKSGLPIEVLKKGLYESKYEKSRLFFLNIKKMFPFEDIGKVSKKDWSNPFYENWYIEKAKRRNYDGIEFLKEITNKRIIVAFEPNQIKLADGSNTTFDANNPDIRFDGGGDVKELSKKQKKEIILIQNKVFADGLPRYKLSADGTWVMALDVRTNRYKSYQDFNSFYDGILEMEREKYARENAQKVFEYLDDSGAELLNKSIYGSRYYIYKNNHIRVSNHDYQSQQTDRETGLPKYKYYKHNFYSYEKDGWQKMISEIESLKNPDIRYAGGGEISKDVDSKLKELGFVFNNANYRYGKTINKQDYITAFYDKTKGLYKIRGVHKFKTPLGENSVGIQFDFDNEKEFYRKINEYLN
jgi:ribosomal protein S18 acetylase RimI-like enzyme